jgi:hypothetical protein
MTIPRANIRAVWLAFLMGALPPMLIAQERMSYQPAHMAADLVRFRDALRYAHPGFHTHESSAAFDRFFTNLLLDARKPLQPVEFYRLVLRLSARLHDGHTRAFASDDLQGYAKHGLLPFHVMIQDQRIFVRRNLSDASLSDGSEIVSIDGVASNAILKTLGSHFGVDGLSTSGLEYRLGSKYNSFYHVYPLVFGFASTHALVVRDHTSREIRELTVARVGPGEFRKRDQTRYGNLLHAWSLEEELATEPLQLRIVRDSAYALLTIRRFFKDGFDEPATVFPTLLSDAFRRVEDARISNLIIDLRGNGGGDGANVAHLVSFLGERPFTPTTRMTFRGNDAYYARITSDTLGLDEYFGLRASDDGFVITRADRIRELGRFPPLGIRPYRGKVVVLIDGGTVSAAGMAAGLIRELTRASFVGQEAGGYAGMSNGVRQLSVRGLHTRTGINFPLAHSEFGVNPHMRKRGVVPDYPVTRSIDDMVDGRDTALNFAVALLNK